MSGLNPGGAIQPHIEFRLDLAPGLSLPFARAVGQADQAVGDAYRHTEGFSDLASERVSIIGWVSRWPSSSLGHDDGRVATRAFTDAVTVLVAGSNEKAPVRVYFGGALAYEVARPDWARLGPDLRERRVEPARNAHVYERGTEQE